MKEAGKMMSKMVKDSTFSQTEPGMKGSLLKVNLKDKESSPTFLLKMTILLSIMDNGLKGSRMEEDMLFIKTMTSMMENLWWDREMDMVHIGSIKFSGMLGSGKTIASMEKVNFLEMTNFSLKDSSNQGWNMEMGFIFTKTVTDLRENTIGTKKEGRVSTLSTKEEN